MSGELDELLLALLDPMPGKRLQASEAHSRSLEAIEAAEEGARRSAEVRSRAEELRESVEAGDERRIVALLSDLEDEPLATRAVTGARSWLKERRAEREARERERREAEERRRAQERAVEERRRKEEARRREAEEARRRKAETERRERERRDEEKRRQEATGARAHVVSGEARQPEEAGSRERLGAPRGVLGPLALGAAVVVVVLVAGLPETGDEGAAEVAAVPSGAGVDPRTNLMWTKKDSGPDIDWHDAKQYCDQLLLGGFTDWRMATIDELEALYDKGESYPCGLWTCHPRLGIDLTNPWVWSSTKKGSSRAWGFHFHFGFRGDAVLDGVGDGRVLCVRGPRA